MIVRMTQLTLSNFKRLKVPHNIEKALLKGIGTLLLYLGQQKEFFQNIDFRYDTKGMK